MSGGSYNYLYAQRNGLEAQRGDIEAMRDRLDQYAKDGVPGAAAAAFATGHVLTLVDQAEAEAQKLSDVWHAVEWRDSGDYGDDQVHEALGVYQTSTALDHKQTPRGADIEILERSRSADGEPILPNTLRINGQDVLMPSGAIVKVSDISESELVTVTLNVFASRISIRHEHTP